MISPHSAQTRMAELQQGAMRVPLGPSFSDAIVDAALDQLSNRGGTASELRFLRDYAALTNRTLLLAEQLLPPHCSAAQLQKTRIAALSELTGFEPPEMIGPELGAWDQWFQQLVCETAYSGSGMHSALLTVLASNLAETAMKHAVALETLPSLYLGQRERIHQHQRSMRDALKRAPDLETALRLVVREKLSRNGRPPRLVVFNDFDNNLSTNDSYLRLRPFQRTDAILRSTLETLAPGSGRLRMTMVHSLQYLPGFRGLLAHYTEMGRASAIFSDALEVARQVRSLNGDFFILTANFHSFVKAAAHQFNLKEDDIFSLRHNCYAGPEKPLTVSQAVFNAPEEVYIVSDDGDHRLLEALKSGEMHTSLPDKIPPQELVFFCARTSSVSDERDYPLQLELERQGIPFGKNALGLHHTGESHGYQGVSRLVYAFAEEISKHSSASK